jgi:hypothetical protein
MRCADLWPQAVAKARAALAEVRPSDSVAIYQFDRFFRPVVSFAESKQFDVNDRHAIMLGKLEQLSPSWASTELGTALIESANQLLEVMSDASGSQGRIVLISDLQLSASLAGLKEFEWPADLVVDVRSVTATLNNAGVEILAMTRELDRTEDDRTIRVRVVNDASAQGEQFRVAWNSSPQAEIPIYVPPGSSRIVKIAPPSDNRSATLMLRGDHEPFDNTAHYASPQQEQLIVYYISSDPSEEPQGLLYYLRRAWIETAERRVTIEVVRPEETAAWSPLMTSPLVVVANQNPPDCLNRYVENGGTVAIVCTEAMEMTLLGHTLSLQDAPVSRYSLWTQMAFDHPLFAPLAGPQYGDFTKIHFWKHRRIANSLDCRVLAFFDNGDPAILEKSFGRGRFVIFMTGWHPEDSQLARSSKFVPLMNALLELRHGEQSATTCYHVGDRVKLPERDTGCRIVKPDGTIVMIRPGISEYADTDRPGIYTIEHGNSQQHFAVNLSISESMTTPMAADVLEQHGCPLVPSVNARRPDSTEQQLRDLELERRQSIWRWLIVIALVVLAWETTFAGWRSLSFRKGA